MMVIVLSLIEYGKYKQIDGQTASFMCLCVCFMENENEKNE